MVEFSTKLVDSGGGEACLQACISAIRLVHDPEIPINVYDLGLIYLIECQLDEIFITMTLTSANCPEAQTLPEAVRNTVEQTTGKRTCVDVVFDPAWNIDNLSDEIKLELGLL